MDFVLSLVSEYFVLIIVALGITIATIIVLTAVMKHAQDTHIEERKRGRYYEEDDQKKNL